MKIRFVVGGLPLSPVSTWGEIRKYTEGGLSGFSLEDYWRIRGLEINIDFESEILATRNKLGLPSDGLTYEEYLKYCNSESKQNAIEIEVQRILKEYTCDFFVKKQIKSILLSNIALPAYPNMSDVGEISIQTAFSEDDLNNVDYTGSEKAVYIKITSKVSPDRVREFIKDRSELLNTLFKKLPNKNKFSLNEEKIKIFILKNQKLSNTSISLKLVENTNKIPRPPKTIDQIFTRTEKDILSLFHKNSTK